MYLFLSVSCVCVCVSSIDDLLWDGSWQCVEEQCEEQHCDEQDQSDDDVLLVASPHQVEETLERIDKPREGGVRATGEEGKRGYSSFIPK